MIKKGHGRLFRVGCGAEIENIVEQAGEETLILLPVLFLPNIGVIRTCPGLWQLPLGLKMWFMATFH